MYFFTMETLLMQVRGGKLLEDKGSSTVLRDLELIIELELGVLEKTVQTEHLQGQDESMGIPDTERDLESSRGPHPVLSSALRGAKLPS